MIDRSSPAIPQLISYYIFYITFSWTQSTRIFALHSTTKWLFSIDSPTNSLRGLSEQAAAKAREVAGLKTEEAKAKTEQVASEASGKATELKHEAKGKAYEAEGKAKATAEEVKAKGRI